MHGPSYTEIHVQNYSWNEDTSFSQDTLICPKGVRNRVYKTAIEDLAPGWFTHLLGIALTN